MAEASGSYHQFGRHYVHEPAHAGTRALHYAGTIIGLFGVTLAILTLTPGPAFTGIVIAYLLAWSGHFFIEKNRPCAFTHPLWSFASNMRMRSEEHTSELQSLRHLVCRLLLENKNISITWYRFNS